MHKKKKRQKKRKFVGLEWPAALSAMRTWIGGHPDTRMNSRIRVSADPPDRQMPVSAACVSNLKILYFLCGLCGLWFLLEPRNTLNTRKGGRCDGCFLHLCAQLSSICVNLRFLSWRSWRFNPISVHPWFFCCFVAKYSSCGMALNRNNHISNQTVY